MSAPPTTCGSNLRLGSVSGSEASSAIAWPGECISQDGLEGRRGLTQSQIAITMGVSQARVSQIEHGKVTEVDAIRRYVEALGGTVDVVARVGDWTVRVA